LPSRMLSSRTASGTRVNSPFASGAASLQRDPLAREGEP
jgi:hypothetical protein